jgi:hypothetical protein
MSWPPFDLDVSGLVWISVGSVTIRNCVPQTYSEWMAGQAGLPQRHPDPREVGTGWMLCGYLLGIVAIFAGVATMAVSPSRSIDIFGGALVIGGLGFTAWATGGTGFFKMFLGVLLIAVLVGGVIELLDVHLLATTP